MSLEIPGAGKSKVSGQLLTAAKMDSRNSFGAPEQVRPVAFAGAHWADGKLRVSMPAKSVVVLTINKAAQGGGAQPPSQPKRDVAPSR